MKHYLIALYIFEVILYSGTTIYSIICTCSDPGVLPNNINVPSIVKNFYLDGKSKYHFIRGFKFKMKFCSTCNIFKPPGVSHCKKCNACVEKFDHHCPWIGNCVGKNNYK